MKYLGGKQRLGKEIAGIILKYASFLDYDEYLEPFCGALGVIVHVASEFNIVEASDYHCDLIELWNAVKKGKFKPPDDVSEEEYYKIKQSKSPSALKAFVGFGCSFGGRFFSSFAQKHTKGKKEHFCREAANSLRRKRPLIQNIEFSCKSYEQWRPKNKVIYCDPPYVQTKYPIKYRRDVKHYDVFDNDKFWDKMRIWSKNNLVIISERTAPNDFVAIWEKKKVNTASKAKKTTLKNNSKNEIIITEKLFVHKSIYNSKYI